MKKPSGASMKVMLALLAVLLVSLGYLSSQSGGREGMSEAMPAPPPAKKNAVVSGSPPSQ